MPIQNFKQLINDIKCGKLASPIFTEADLAAIKACLPAPQDIPTSNPSITNPVITSCVNDGISEVQKIVRQQTNRQGFVIELATVKAKVQEALDHYSFILEYFKERLKFFNDTLTRVEPFTSQYLYFGAEVSKYDNLIKSQLAVLSNSGYDITALQSISDSLILKLSDDFSNSSNVLSNLTLTSPVKQYLSLRKIKITADGSALIAKRGGASALAKKIESLTPLPELAIDAQAELAKICSSYSSQLNPIFTSLTNLVPSEIKPPNRTAAFGIRIIGLNGSTISVSHVDDHGKSTNSDKQINVLTNVNLTKNPFRKTSGEYCYGIDPMSKPLELSDYDKLVGALYNKTSSGYEGLYRKLAKPVQFLYSLEERGLTIDPSKTDPMLNGIKDAPVSIKIEDQTLFISNQSTYEKFYETLTSTLPTKIKIERAKNFPKEISTTLSKLRDFAQREVADQFRGITSIGSGLSDKLAYYKKAHDELVEKIADCNSQIDLLDTAINQNSMSPDSLAKDISVIPCFSSVFSSPQQIQNCEAETMKKLGTDPLLIRTLSGNDANLPDLNTPCYWREFCKELNKVSLLPVPDLTSPPFRYYPVNNIIPTPVGVVLVTLPQKWKPLFVLPSALGTLITFLVMPVAVVGIPLPSIFMLYLSPDGRKYMIFAPNLPVLYPSAIQYGYEFDSNAINPTGLSGPHKGLFTKGSLSSPLSISAASSKASRLTSIAADLALGNKSVIRSKDGTKIGEIDSTTYLDKYLSTSERAKNSADFDPAKDFDKTLTKFRKNVNRQFDKLGEMQITAVSKLKDKTRSARHTGVMDAENEKDSKNRRNLKNAARKIDPIELGSKIDSILSDVNSYIDKIKLGTIYFPEDPTKMNPKLPGSISGLISTLEHASVGGMMKPSDSTNLLKKIKRSAASIDPNKLPGKKTFNLINPEDFKDFKKALSDYSSKALKYLSGEESPADDIDPNLPEKDQAKIKKAATLRKSRLKTALAFTTLAVATPSLKLFDPAAPCCETSPNLLENAIPPQVKASIAVFTALFDAFINGLTIDSLRSILGESVGTVGISTVSVMFDTVVSMFPPITLPEKPDLVSISQALLIPILTAISIPQAPNPLGVPLPIQIAIPLDSIVKPLLKAAIAYLIELILRMLADSANLLKSDSISGSSVTVQQIVQQIPCGGSQTATVTTTNVSNTVSITLPNGVKVDLKKVPTIPLDIIQYFSLLTSTDLVTLIRNLVLVSIDSILVPLKTIIEPILSVATSLKDLSYNIIEASNPFISTIKLIKMAIELQIPNSSKIQIANFDALNAVKAAYFPVIEATEPVVSEIAWLGSIVACATGPTGITLARTAANPFLNQDDLPPWERLTRKNPLFAIFLDEIAWRSSLVSTGSLLFQTKMPGLYPTAWSPTIFSDPGALYHN